MAYGWWSHPSGKQCESTTYATQKSSRAYRLSMNDYRQEEWLTNIPLYAVEHLILKISCTDHYRALLISSMTRENSSFVSEA